MSEQCRSCKLFSQHENGNSGHCHEHSEERNKFDWCVRFIPRQPIRSSEQRQTR